MVTRGIYRYVRHPIYLGGAIALLGSFLLRLNGVTTAMYALFIAGEIYRAVLEEAKLRAYLPAYAAYQSRVPMFGFRFPKRRSGT